MTALGTRVRQNFHNERNPQGALTKFYTRDLGMSKNVTASTTFAAGTGKATAAAATFAAFAVGDDVVVEGTNTNNGYFHVIATDASTFITLDPPPKNEGPVSATVRSLF